MHYEFNPEQEEIGQGGIHSSCSTHPHPRLPNPLFAELKGTVMVPNKQYLPPAFASLENVSCPALTTTRFGLVSLLLALLP